MQVSGYNYSYYSPYSPNQSSGSAASMTGLLDTLATGPDGHKSGASNTSQAAITGAAPGASSASTQVFVPGASYLTQSDLALIKETTGQTIDPKTGEPVNASGQVVLWNIPDMTFEMGLIEARMAGIPNGGGGATPPVTGDITVADLQSLANQYSGIRGTAAVFQKAEAILNGSSSQS